MADILVRDLDDAAVEGLRRRAGAAGRSLEAEAKMVLEGSTGWTDGEKVDMATARKLLDEFRAKFKGRKFSDSVELIREDRDNR